MEVRGAPGSGKGRGRGRERKMGKESRKEMEEKEVGNRRGPGLAVAGTEYGKR